MHLLLLLAGAALASDLDRALSPFVVDRARRARLEERVSAAERDLKLDLGVDEVPLTRMVVANLAAKREEGERVGVPFPLEEGEIERTVIDYEAFKLRTFLTAGVFPKRYFGYLDDEWDTAEQEKVLRDTVRAAVAVCNEDLAARGSPLRLTHAEVAVTFLAEGGALMLEHAGKDLDHIHPVLDIGLDSIVYGVGGYAGLVEAMDDRLGTHLGSTVEGTGDQARLVRYFDLRDAIAGTALMLVYEKSLAERKLAEEGRASLAARPLDEQYVITSLHYNSGLLFSEARVQMLRTFSTGEYLYDVSERTWPRRDKLPVAPKSDALALLTRAGAYPDQWTSWNAVYHVLQRYGAYVALKRFADDFDEQDMFGEDPPVRAVVAPVVVPPAEGAVIQGAATTRGLGFVVLAIVAALTGWVAVTVRRGQ